MDETRQTTSRTQDDARAELDARLDAMGHRHPAVGPADIRAWMGIAMVAMEAEEHEEVVRAMEAMAEAAGTAEAAEAAGFAPIVVDAIRVLDAAAEAMDAAMDEAEAMRVLLDAGFAGLAVAAAMDAADAAAA